MQIRLPKTPKMAVPTDKTPSTKTVKNSGMSGMPRQSDVRLKSFLLISSKISETLGILGTLEYSFSHLK